MGPTYCAPGMVNLFFAEKLPWPGAIVACQSAAKKIYVSERSLTSKRSYDDPADARPAHPGENRAGDARALRREGRRSHHHWRHRQIGRDTSEHPKLMRNSYAVFCL